jgi:predicted RNA-binding protein with PIN domain
VYLIDANNVMGKSLHHADDNESARQKLLHQLALVSRVKKIRITAVFDGTESRQFAEGSAFRGVRILYARPGSDADSRIIEIVERERNRKALTIVTSDNALAGYIRSCGVRVMKSQELRRMMAECQNVSSASGSSDSVSSANISKWMRYFGVDEDD